MKTEIKPIITIGVFAESDEILTFIAETVNKTIKDYYILVYPLINKEDIKFNLLSVNDMDEVKFEELKEFIKKQINNETNN